MATKSFGQDICVFTETHQTGEFKILDERKDLPESSELEGWTFIHSGVAKKAYAGVGVPGSPNVQYIAHRVIEAGRILRTRLKFRGVKILLFAVYAPTNTQSDAAKSNFFNRLARAVAHGKKQHPRWPRLIIGVLNSTLGIDAPLSHYIGSHNLDTVKTTNNGFRITEFFESNQMYALNTLFQVKKPIHRITHINSEDPRSASTTSLRICGSGAHA